jgi:hypothetical protein
MFLDIWHYQILLAPFLVTYVFWLSRKVVTNSAVDRYSGLTGIFDTSLNHRQTSIHFAWPFNGGKKTKLTRMCQEIWHGKGELWKQCWSVQQGRDKKKHSIMLMGWVYHVVVCPRVAILLCCYLLANNSFPKKWLLLKGICHTKRKTESGRGSNVGSCWPDLASKWWNIGH